MLHTILHALVLLLGLASTAWAGSVTLVLSENSGPYAEFAKALSEKLDGTNWKLNTATPEKTIPPAELIVTAGNEALRQTLASSGTTPIIATLLPRQNYENAIAESGKTRRRITAIYLDQPPARQAIFIQQLLPGQSRVGILSSPETRAQNNRYQQLFKNKGLNLDSEDSDTPGALLPAINNLLPRVDVLLAIPDNTIYKRDNIKVILMTSYRHQRPVIAYSPAFVNAGALAALYTTPAQLGQQTAELITRTGTSLPQPVAPSQFAIAINANVAKALGIQIPDEATIRRAILAELELR